MAISPAPKMNALSLWHMSAEAYTLWRQQNDYPRIVAYLKQKLPEFETWMKGQKVTDDMLIRYSPSTFLKNKTVYYYHILHDGKDKKEVVDIRSFSVGEVFFHKNLVEARQEIIPYPVWYRKTFKKRAPDISINQKTGRSHIVLSGLELLDMGNCHITNLFLGHRILDFVNVSDLTITNCYNNSSIVLDFSSASNVTIQGDLPFLQAYGTSFSEVMNGRTQNLKLLSGSFQRWSFYDCDVHVFADNAILHGWSYTGEEFDGTLTSSDIVDCSFKSIPIQYPIQLNRSRVFHGNLKRIYSQLGKKKAASNHFYWEKTYERKSFLYVQANHREALLNKRWKWEKRLVHVRYVFKYVGSMFLNRLWGYGERPWRVFGISIATIFLFALSYCYLPGASIHTAGKFSNSLYYSMVTFTTLGYGDMSQTASGLRLLSGLEALLGMSFWGILIAGFTNNAKDY